MSASAGSVILGERSRCVTRRNEKRGEPHGRIDNRASVPTDCGLCLKEETTLPGMAGRHCLIAAPPRTHLPVLPRFPFGKALTVSQQKAADQQRAEDGSASECRDGGNDFRQHIEVRGMCSWLRRGGRRF